MALILSGTDGVSDIDGTAATPAIRGTDANTGIFFGTDIIGFSEGGTECARFDASANFQFNSGYGSVATAYGCRAWVNFNGTGTVAIRASANVSSITDNGVGDYTINFTTALADANYSLTASCSTAIGIAVQGGVNLFYNKVGNVEVAPTTSAARIQPQSNTASAIDPQYVCVAVFR